MMPCLGLYRVVLVFLAAMPMGRRCSSTPRLFACCSKVCRPLGSSMAGLAGAALFATSSANCTSSKNLRSDNKLRSSSCARPRKAVLSRFPEHPDCCLCAFTHSKLHDRVVQRGQRYLARPFPHVAHDPDAWARSVAPSASAMSGPRRGYGLLGCGVAHQSPHRSVYRKVREA